MKYYFQERVIYENVRQVSLGQMVAEYGNMGYGEFKGGIKKQKGFVPNMTIFQEKIHILKNG